MEGNVYPQAIAELNLRGFVSIGEDGSSIGLTSKGIEKAKKLLHSLGHPDYWLVVLLIKYGVDEVTDEAGDRGYAEEEEVQNLRKFGPKEKSHPSVGKECPACHIPFKEGDYTVLIPLGPGSNPEEREKARRGKSYNSVAVEVHWSCATGEEARPLEPA